MAVTITRSVWIDDDGSGTTGTVINQALHTTLYNEIDTALAKVAQLAGGNAFTGNQSIAGVLTVSGAGSHSFAGKLLVNTLGNAANAQFMLVANGSAVAGFGFQNSDPANNIFFLQFLNSTGGSCGYINQTGATTVNYQTSSDQRLKVDEGRAMDVAALRAVVVHDFTWKADGVRDRGVFAQEAYTSFPRAIGRGTDERTDDGTLVRPWMTDYSKFVPDLIVGWQQHDAALAELRALLATVKG